VSGHSKSDERYGYRAARDSDIALLADIEREAAQAFLPFEHVTGLNAAQLEHTVEIETLRTAQAAQLLWVVTFDDTPVGFSVLVQHGAHLHVHEIDIHPAHARRGLGKMLLDRASQVSRDLQCTALTLTTYRDVPWNAPYYARLGFRELRPDEWTPALQTIFVSEQAMGWRVAERVAMIRNITAE
jgi:GNAT superfamily N-acetyltransferase